MNENTMEDKDWSVTKKEEKEDPVTLQGAVTYLEQLPIEKSLLLFVEESHEGTD